MAPSRNLLKSARLFHLYSGVFFTPALLFFAFTGAVQSMNFHETTRGRNYKPPAILVKLAQLHKKETLVLPERKAPPPSGQPAILSGPTVVPSSASPTSNPPALGKHDRLPSGQAAERPIGPIVASSTPSPQPAPTEPPRKAPNTLALKIFSFWAGVGLFLSTLTGLYMSYKFARNKAILTATLFAGLLIPFLLLYIQ